MGGSACWGLLNQDTAWINLVQDDLRWVWYQLENASDLGDPCVHIERWLEIMQFHRQYWKRLVRRACRHAVLQRKKHFRCQQFYTEMKQLLVDHGHWTLPDSQEYRLHQAKEEQTFGCMACKRSFLSLGGEGAHMFRTHQVVNAVRYLFNTTQCGGCLKEYFTHGKMKMHLLRSATCRAYLLSHDVRYQPAPGLGSSEDQERHLRLDNRLPPLQALGPRRPRPRDRDLNLVHWTLHDSIVEAAFALTDELDFESTVRSLIEETPISWTRCVVTLQELRTTMDTETEPLGVVSLPHANKCLGKLCHGEEWPFLHTRGTYSKKETKTIGDLEEQFQSLTTPQDLSVGNVQRCLGRHKIVLHAFSGRRRLGDIQFFMEELQKSIADGTLLHVVSLDLMTDPVWGDATRQDTKDFWRNAADAGLVHGLLAGPPCESWSQARFAQTGEKTGPRPIRSAEALWGMESLTLRELAQILVGNDLLFFAFDLLLRLYFSQGFGVIEHPDEPEEDYKPSIWKLPILTIFRLLPGFEELRFAQGLLGASSPKPTRLLALNLPCLQRTLRAHHITKDLPRRSSIGKQNGVWSTGFLKEYPPAMSRALAVEFMAWFDRQCTDAQMTEDHAFLARCKLMSATTMTDRIGHDFTSKT